MRSLLAFLLAVLCCWLGPVSATPAYAAPARPVTAYAYDGHHHGSVLTYTTTERGLPASNEPGTTYDAVDRRSHGASARMKVLGAEPTAADTTSAGVTPVHATPGTTTKLAEVIGGGPSPLLRAGVAANGGANAVRIGQAGETAVGSAFDIGPKATRVINGRTRIFDGLNSSAVSEVKNVGYQAYTQQLKDSLTYAQQNGLRFDLFVRGGATPTRLSGPLETAIRNGDITLRYIP